jgi:hypothetical protein
MCVPDVSIRMCVEGFAVLNCVHRTTWSDVDAPATDLFGMHGIHVDFRWLDVLRSQDGTDPKNSNG